jgi:hypothetical protein
MEGFREDEILLEHVMERARIFRAFEQFLLKNPIPTTIYLYSEMHEQRGPPLQSDGRAVQLILNGKKHIGIAIQQEPLEEGAYNVEGVIPAGMCIDGIVDLPLQTDVREERDLFARDLERLVELKDAEPDPQEALREEARHAPIFALTQNPPQGALFRASSTREYDAISLHSGTATQYSKAGTLTSNLDGSPSVILMKNAQGLSSSRFFFDEFPLLVFALGDEDDLETRPTFGTLPVG